MNALFSPMKMVKSRLRNRLGEANISYLMKIALESPEALSDEELENRLRLFGLESLEELLFDNKPITCVDYD